MSVYIKNNTNEVINLIGQDIDPYSTVNDYFLILNENEVRWANDTDVLVAISKADIIVAKRDDNNSDILDISEAINYLKGISSSKVELTVNSTSIQSKNNSLGVFLDKESLIEMIMQLSKVNVNLEKICLHLNIITDEELE